MPVRGYYYSLSYPHICSLLSLESVYNICDARILIIIMQ